MKDFIKLSKSPTWAVKQVNRATAQTAQEVALEEGLEPLMMWVKRFVDLIIQIKLGQDDAIEPQRFPHRPGLRRAAARRVGRAGVGDFGDVPQARLLEMKAREEKTAAELTEALRKEKDAASKERLVKLEKEIADLKEEATQLRSHWEQEKEAIQRGRELKERLEQVRLEVERAQRGGDYAKASELQYGQVPAIEADLKKQEARLQDLQKAKSMLKEEVDEEDIAEVVGKWTGIPVSRLMEGEVQKLLQLSTELHKRVVGQEDAVDAVADAVMRARPGDRLLALWIALISADRLDLLGGATSFSVTPFLALTPLLALVLVMGCMRSAMPSSLPRPLLRLPSPPA